MKRSFTPKALPRSKTSTARGTAIQAHADVDVQRANLALANAQLNQARVNLSYTKIYAPIDGVVISRAVDVGQTVAASLQAPTLFTIAQDLRKMQVDTSVSEGDVGRLREGATATFRVDAFPSRRFEGRIRQIRNAVTTTQNVVTYDAVVDVDNPDLALRPGMTANVTVVVDSRTNVVVVPNAALRFHLASETHHAPHEVVALYHGVARTIPLEVGISDGRYTEIFGDALTAGQTLVIGSNAPKTDSTAMTKNPFQSGGPPPGGPPPGPPPR